MRRRTRTFVLMVALAAAAAAPSDAVGQALSRGERTLASPGAGTWWRGRVDGRWAGPDSALERAIAWRSGAQGIEWAELEIEVNDGPLRVHTILVRLDPRRMEADLVHQTDASRVRGAWTIDAAGDDVILAMNAGQFQEAGPWGWLVSGGVERALPGVGPLAVAIGFDSTGLVRWLDHEQVGVVRRRGRDAWPTTAFQSYPRLLVDGAMPALVRSGRGMDPGHRDARLAFGTLVDGRVLIALTRFGPRPSAVARIPIGLTVPETAALMGALGARDAVMLDGGLSAQLMLRDPRMAPLKWAGLRKVPVALVFRRR